MTEDERYEALRHCRLRGRGGEGRALDTQPRIPWETQG